MAGDAVARSGAHAELVRVAELLGAPVWAEVVPSSASYPASHPLFRGALARQAPVIRRALAEADVLFSAGADLVTMSLPSDVEPVPEGLAIVHLDTDPWELGKNYPARVAILGDPRATLPELAQAVEERQSAAARRRAADRLAAARADKERQRAELVARARSEAGRVPITPLALVHAVAETLPPEAVVVDETISSGAGLRTLLRSDDPQSFFGLRGGGIGWGLPAAVGVKLALPGRPVVALVGDGSAMYTVQALWTAARERLGVVFVILNNGGYRILKMRIHAAKGFAARHGRYVGMDLDAPAIDFVALAASLGVRGERVEKTAEVGPALARALAGPGPALLDVALDPAFTSP